jgi:predicted HTH domain antitoxin
MTADLVIPGQVLEQAQFSPSELRLEIAVYLYAKERLTMGQGRRLAGIDRIAFQKELSKRGVYIHYDVNDLHDDLSTLGID